MVNNYKKKVLLLIVLIFNFISCTSIEEPKYYIIRSFDDFEIRKYRPRIAAEVRINKDFKAAGNSGFRILADYIFGKNTIEKKISTKISIDQELDKNTKISMTAPVEMSGENNYYIIRFYMPSKYTIKSLPKFSLL